MEVISAVIKARYVDEQSVVVIDDLFAPDFLRIVDHYLRSLRFSLADYDAEDNKHVRHWIHEFKVESIGNHPLLSVIYSRIKSASAEFDSYRSGELELKRAHCNASLYGDIQFPHHDLKPGVTWLYYANPSWNLNWMGETIFYDSHDEPVCAVYPKPGRVILFSADILHRGGVPSRECLEARRSIAFKFLYKNR